MRRHGAKHVRLPSYVEEFLSLSFVFMSVGTHCSDSFNGAQPQGYHPYSHRQWLTYGSQGIFDSSSREMSYRVPNMAQGEIQINIWVDSQFPIHGEVVERNQDLCLACS